MHRKYSELDSETAESLSSVLEAQAKTSFEAAVATDKWLTQHNFLANAGGAAAVMGYLSSEQTTEFAVIPLGIFIVGIITSGLEIRYLMKVHSELHLDALRRRSGFVSDKLSVEQAGDVKAPSKMSKNMNHYCGLISQWSFALASMIGLFLFVAHNLC